MDDETTEQLAKRLYFLMVKYDPEPGDIPWDELNDHNKYFYCTVIKGMSNETDLALWAKLNGKEE